MNRQSILTGGLFLLSLFLFAGCQDNNEAIKLEWRGEIYNYEFQYTAKEQKTSERNWENITLNRQSFENDHFDDLYTPLEIQLDSTGNVYILDQGDKKIKKYTPSGDFLKGIGPGTGRGPGEFLSPYDFAIDSSGNFYIVDLNRRALISIDSTGDFRWQKLFKYDAPGRVAAGGNKVFLSISGVNNFSPFQSFFNDGVKSVRYSPIVKKPDNVESLPVYVTIEGMPLTGKFAPYSNGKLIYAPRFIPHLIFFKKDGSIDFAVKTIDEVSLPRKIYTDKITNLGNGKKMPQTEFKGTMTSMEINILKNLLIVWSKTGNEKFGAHVFDLYDISKGNYVYSFKIDELGAITDILFSENYLYTLNGATATVNMFKIESAPWL